MSANLEVVNGAARMFYAKDAGVPWHEDGTAVDTAVGYREALALAGMDWEVELRKVRLVDGAQIPTHRATVRTEDNRPLGIVGPDYKIIQNAQAAEWLDSLYADGKLLFDTAGSIDSGGTLTLWMLARLTEDMRVGDDVFARYLLATWRHNGSMSLQIYATAVRVVCENTWNAAIGGKMLAAVRHTGNIVAKLDAARAILQITDAQHDRMLEWLKQANEVKVSEADVVSVQETLFGTLDDATPTQRRNAIDAFMGIYREEADRTGETAYALANTVMGYGDYKVRVTKNNSRMGTILFGQANVFKKHGLAAVTKLVAAKS